MFILNKPINAFLINTSFFNTNYTESKDILSDIFWIFLFSLSLLIFLAFQLKKRNIKLTIKKIFSFFFLIIVANLFIIVKSDAYQRKFNDTSFIYNLKYTTLLLVKKTYPLNLIRNIRTAFLINNNVKRYKTKTKDFAFNFTSKDSLSSTIILVIGESSRSQNFQINGYNRETTPKLNKRVNLVSFTDAYTPYSSTTNSVPFSLSRISTKNWQKNKYEEKSLITAMKELGYKTYFIDNQGDYSSLLDFYKNESDTLILNPIMSKDITMLTSLKALLSEKTSKKFIILHSYGSHFHYNERYSEEYSTFKPDEYKGISKDNKEYILNVYDNTILYLDTFLNKTIELVEEINADLLYYSDHGENLYDTKENFIFHSYFEPNDFTLKIPIIYWTSNQNEKLDFANKNKYKTATTKSIFHTVVNLATNDTLYYNPKKSIVNKKYQNADTIFYFSEEDDLKIYKFSGNKLMKK